jgi:hypothetical protein
MSDLFNNEFDYEKEWEGMPEFIAEDLNAKHYNYLIF